MNLVAAGVPVVLPPSRLSFLPHHYLPLRRTSLGQAVIVFSFFVFVEFLGQQPQEELALSGAGAEQSKGPKWVLRSPEIRKYLPNRVSSSMAAVLPQTSMGFPVTRRWWSSSDQAWG